MSSTDFLVLGAGTAGSIITRRLLDAGHTVTLVEAGGLDTNPAIHDLARVGELWFGPEDWAFRSTPQARAHGRRLHIPRGRVVGGSGQLNGTIWVHGAPWDYDGWAAAGNPGWDWASVAPLFERLEVGTPPGSDAARMDIVRPELSPVQQAIIDAAVAWGLPLNADYNAGEQDGVSRMIQNLRGGRRLSTWAAYMRPVLDHPRLTLITGALVDSVTVDRGRVTGATILRDGARERIDAGRVVLAAGAIGSPAVLLRSGIGPADELRAVGVEVTVDAPGVGRNLQDHFLVPVVFETTVPIDPPRPFHPVAQTHWFWRSSPDLPVPDTQPINFSVPFLYDLDVTPPAASAFTLHAGLIRPHSTGSVTLAGRDPHAAPLIDFNLFADERDLDALVKSVRQCREVGRQAPLAEGWGATEAIPGGAVDDGDEALREWVRRAVNTYHHAAGTCRMGVDEQAVVSPTLQVHGVECLTVADASVMPAVTTGNTNAPTAMIAERAADVLLAG